MTDNAISFGTQSITLDGDYKSTWPNAWAFYHIKNIGDSDALVSTIEELESLAAPTTDNPGEVIAVQAGSSLTIPGRNSATLLTSGKVQIIANNDASCPFKCAQVANEEQPGQKYIFEGKYECLGWTYSLDPTLFINQYYCQLPSGTLLTVTGYYPDEKQNLRQIRFIATADSNIVNSKVYIDIFDENDTLITSRSDSFSSKTLDGGFIQLKEAEKPLIYGKLVKIVFSCDGKIQLSRIYLSYN